LALEFTWSSINQSLTAVDNPANVAASAVKISAVKIPAYNISTMETPADKTSSVTVPQAMTTVALGSHHR
jgi:hypothetical protein